MPPRGEPPLHHETIEDEDLESDIESLPDLAPATEPATIQDDDYLVPTHDSPNEDTPTTDSDTAAPFPLGNVTNPALFAAFLAKTAQQQHTEDNPPSDDATTDHHS